MSAETITKSQLPTPIRWTKSLYHQMGELGWFRDKRVQLIEGEIVEMAPMGKPHWVAINKINRALIGAFPADRYTIAMQCPVDIATDSEPEPDLTVVDGIPDDFIESLPAPSQIRLIVEVSDSTIAFDRGRKSKIYAAAGIEEYWIVNIATRCVEVLRSPLVAESRYTDSMVYQRDATLSPLSAPTAAISVSELIA